MTRSTMREHIFKLLFRAPFIDNKDDAEMIKDKTKDDLFARGVLRGIKKYL